MSVQVGLGGPAIGQVGPGANAATAAATVSDGLTGPFTGAESLSERFSLEAKSRLKQILTATIENIHFPLLIIIIVIKVR